VKCFEKKILEREASAQSENYFEKFAQLSRVTTNGLNNLMRIEQRIAHDLS
jgi:hypothetical protein